MKYDRLLHVYLLKCFWKISTQIKFKDKKFPSDLPIFGQNWVNNRNRNIFFVSADTETDTERAFCISAKPKFGRNRYFRPKTDTETVLVIP